jgi:hypothetical protein
MAKVFLFVAPSRVRTASSSRRGRPRLSVHRSGRTI